MTAVVTAAQQSARTRSAIAARAQALALVAVGWGALAFGGAYPWAYWPLAMMMFAAGALGIAIRAGVALINPKLVAVFALPVAAVAIQLIPLPLPWLRVMSPNAVGILEKTDFAYGAGLTRFHSLSI